ncbi:MAG: hypothetical protein ACE5G1_17670 [bacterium]
MISAYEIWSYQVLTELAKIPAWAAAIIAALTFFSCIQTARKRSLARKLTPSLDIVFKPTAPWVSALVGNVPPKQVEFVAGSSAPRISRIGQRNARCVFVRLEIRAKTDETVRGCTAWIRDIEFFENDKWTPTAFSTSLRLRWVSDQTYGSHDVPKSGKLFVDLFSTDEIYNTILPKVETGLIENEDIFSRLGRYRITVFVAPEVGKESEGQFVIDWRGQWNDFDVQVVGGDKGTITWPEENT